MGYLGGDRGAPEMVTLPVQARSASVQAFSPSGQVKAAVGQAGHRKLELGEKDLMFDYRGILRG